MGTALMITGQNGLWQQVRLPDGYQGWVHGGLLQLGDDGLIRRWSRGARILVVSPWTMVYSKRTRTSPPVSDVVIGTRLRPLGESPRWLEIGLPDERKGWLARSDTIDTAKLVHLQGGTPEEICRTARSFLGLPYLWGGTTPKGFDCSGFVQTVFRLNGHSLPRDACQQFQRGGDICSKSELAAADLLFFKAAGADRITHVAIHLAGGQFIHCSDFVRINSFNRSAGDYDASLEAQYVGAKKIVGGPDGTC
jgi:cell wall-associated NlpC family hydrolase